MPLRGNEKRKETSKKVGGVNKKKGHDLEILFNEFFDKPNPLSYKAEADCTITNLDLIEKLNRKFGKAENYHISLKSGRTQQHTLGRIDEVSTLPDDKKLAVFSTRAFWGKYLGKTESAKPPTFYVYRHTNPNTWIFFQMNDVVEFIIDKCRWRLLETGRIKGDFDDVSNKGYRQYLTYEYRPKKGFFLGACGGNSGINFVELLKSNLLYVEVTDPVK